jgi:hypothetical protein
VSKLTWHARLVLIRPGTIQARLSDLVAGGVIERAPNLWQIELGVLRMWHRVLFRFATIGTCGDHARRTGWRARLLAWRPIRAPFLIWERAIAPLDHSGLGVAPKRIVAHLLAAHHDRVQFAYDLSMLKATPALLEDVRDRAAATATGATERDRWLQDLTVFQGYHESLRQAADSVIRGESILSEGERADPDIAFEAYITWCLAQPKTPRETWRAWRRGLFPSPLESPSEAASLEVTP